MEKGDTCNTGILHFPSHTGTHVDAPFHFYPHGRAVHEYPPESWIFSCPVVIDMPAAESKLLNEGDILNLSSTPENNNVDLLLIRTGFERFRGQDSYWNDGPGLSPSLAGYFLKRYPNVRAAGMDCLSISSIRFREQGREAHRAFLGQGLLLFEDMRLSEIGPEDRLEKVMAFPLRFDLGDGAPCTVIGGME
jgi:arylformamidase